MVRNSINLSFGIASLISGLSTGAVQSSSTLSAKSNANTKLYHDRKGSQIENFFRKLPSIEDEVDSIFDDASYFASFGASPQVEQKSNQAVEELFRRLSQEEAQKPSARRKLSFLGNKMQEVGIVGEAGAGDRGAIRGSVDGATEDMPVMSEEPMVPTQNIVPSSSLSEGMKIGKQGKSSKIFKGIGDHLKDAKKGKRYKGELGNLIK